MLGAAPHLGGQYTAFGRVADGFECSTRFTSWKVDGEAPKQRVEIIVAKIE